MTGYTWDQVDELTLPRLNALFDSWETRPPAALSLARIAMAFGAWKPPASRHSAGPRRQKTREEILAEFAPLIGRGVRVNT